MLVTPALNHVMSNSGLTVSQVMERILSEVPGGKLGETVDNLKSGSGDLIVTGIITTMFATIEVIETAIRLKANFIIAHEPTFYNHTDDLNWVENNEVAREKKSLLEKNQIAVWRFHDYWHRMKPDGILHGFLVKTNWLQYNPKEESVFRMPSQPPMGDIMLHIKNSLRIPHLRYIGKMDSICSTIAVLPGAWGGQNQLNTAIKGKADLIIVGESSEWELPEYVRDAERLGKEISLIVLGHAYSEEPGMEWLVEWLRTRIPDLAINHIASGEPFTWL